MSKAGELAKQLDERAILCDYLHGDPSSAHTADALRAAASTLSSQEEEIEGLRKVLARAHTALLNADHEANWSCGDRLLADIRRALDGSKR